MLVALSTAEAAYIALTTAVQMLELNGKTIVLYILNVY